MSTQAVQKSQKVANKRLLAQIILSICAVSIALSVFSLRQNKQRSYHDRHNNGPPTNDGLKLRSILKGTTSSGTSYYYCGLSSWPSIVLLHGAKFTKEEWKTSGILQMFCDNDVAVAALDLSVRATSAELLNTLKELSLKDVVSTPIALIITPSASGFTMMDGVLNGNVDSMKQQILRWVPVATNAANQLSETALGAAKVWPMLAVYGDQDIVGKKSSYLWGRVAGAKIVELKVRAVYLFVRRFVVLHLPLHIVIQGRHPVYLDSPNEFVKVVLNFLMET